MATRRFTRRSAAPNRATRTWEAVWEDSDGNTWYVTAEVCVFRLEPEVIRAALGIPDCVPVDKCMFTPKATRAR
jgi:hypothetical protein